MLAKQRSLFPVGAEAQPVSEAQFIHQIETFQEFGTKTNVAAFPDPAVDIPVYVNEFWIARQRAAGQVAAPGGLPGQEAEGGCFRGIGGQFFIHMLWEAID
mgnify:FL=1